MRIALICFSILLLAACGGPNAPRAFSVSENGAHLETPTFEKGRIERILAEQITTGLGQPWRAEASIAEAPEWDPILEEFRWNAATIAITVGGPEGATLPSPEAEIAAAVNTFMHERMARNRAPIIGINRVVIAATGRLYTVREGDTLSRIAAAYYGQDDAWPRILDANPGIDPAALTPGTVLNIPE